MKLEVNGLESVPRDYIVAQGLQDNSVTCRSRRQGAKASKTCTYQRSIISILHVLYDENETLDKVLWKACKG